MIGKFNLASSDGTLKRLDQSFLGPVYNQAVDTFAKITQSLSGFILLDCNI